MEESAAHSRAAPGRSCVACRKRKIRCNRQQPCSYCTKLHVPCIYPELSPEEKRNPTNDVVSRLERIETLLQQLEMRIATSESPQPGRDQSSSVNAADDMSGAAQASPEPESGNIISEEGDTRYVTRSLWTDHDVQDDPNHQDANLDTITAARASESSRTTTTTTTGEPGRHRRHGLILGFDFTSSDLRQLHPTESRIFFLWQVFLESVDPILKLIHVPVTQRQILRATLSMDSIPPAFESLMFSIYYAAVTSMQYSVSGQNLRQEERHDFLDRYRFGLEQALVKANFLSAPEVQTLQAFTLYLICARHWMDKTYVWTMTGLAIRIATKLGLHRDPVALGLPPFVSEMRRRLWWQILILDVRTAEENDMDPAICEHDFDTELPSNVDDADLDVNMARPVIPRRDRTEMLFTLTRFEISYAARKWVFSPKFTKDNGYSTAEATTYDDKNESIDALQKALEDKYLQHCDTRVPICFLAVTAMRMVLAKIKLTINHPAYSGSSALSRNRLLELVKSSVDIVEYAHTLRSSDKYSRWVWLFQKYIEWDAVAFLLHSLSAAPLSPLADRAWKAVDVFFHDWQSHDPDEQRWRRLHTLHASAVSKRRPIIRSLALDMQPSPANMTGHPSVEEHARGAISTSASLAHSPRSGPESAHHASATRPDPAGTTTTTTQPDVPDSSNALSSGDDLDWTFDPLPSAIQDSVGWEMDVDEAAFTSWL